MTNPELRKFTDEGWAVPLVVSSNLPPTSSLAANHPKMKATVERWERGDKTLDPSAILRSDLEVCEQALARRRVADAESLEMDVHS